MCNTWYIILFIICKRFDNHWRLIHNSQGRQEEVRKDRWPSLLKFASIPNCSEPHSNILCPTYKPLQNIINNIIWSFEFAKMSVKGFFIIGNEWHYRIGKRSIEDTVNYSLLRAKTTLSLPTLQISFWYHWISRVSISKDFVAIERFFLNQKAVNPITRYSNNP